MSNITLSQRIAHFDAYFRSKNSVPPNVRISVPTAEWQELHADLTTADESHMRELTAYRTTVQNQEAELSALRARCAELEDGWQPIAAAPKSGRTLMLGFFNGAGKWRTTRGQWFSKEQIEDTWEDGDDCEEGWYETPVVGEVCYPVAPTHWMPLPAAPGAAESTAEPA